MPVNDVYRPSVDYTLAEQVTSPVSGKTAFVPSYNSAGMAGAAVAGGETDEPLGTAGAAGDYLSHLVLVPGTTSPGAVSVTDGTTVFTVFEGGASSLSNLIPFTVPLGLTSVGGGWTVTTGADISVIAGGRFTNA